MFWRKSLNANPAMENKRSALADVAGTDRNRAAMLARCGYSFSCCAHHSRMSVSAGTLGYVNHFTASFTAFSFSGLSGFGLGDDFCLRYEKEFWNASSQQAALTSRGHYRGHMVFFFYSECSTFSTTPRKISFVPPTGSFGSITGDAPRFPVAAVRGVPGRFPVQNT